MEYVIYIQDAFEKVFLMNPGKDFSWTKDIRNAHKFKNKTAAREFQLIHMSNFNGLETKIAVLIRGWNVPYCLTYRSKLSVGRQFFTEFDKEGKASWTQELDSARLFATFTEACRFMYENTDKLKEYEDNIQIESLNIITDYVPCFGGNE